MTQQDHDVDWDIDAYCTDYESDEHWQLRRKFMDVHKDKFPEDRLVCLAQTFINIEFMGCKYPDETMRQVAELSQEVAKEFRDSRAGKLKRTFVGAAAAAEQRVKGRRNAQQQQQQRQQQQQAASTSATNLRGNTRVSFKTKDDDNDRQPTQNKRARQVNLFSGLPYGSLVIQLIGGRNCLSLSAQRNKMKYEERVKDIRKVEIYLDEQLIASAEEPNLKASKQEAFKRALSLLQTKCYSIKPNPLQDIIKIDKKDSEIICGVVKASADGLDGQKIDDSNKGFKMMKMMGWTGGGLGAAKQGREDPVNYLFKNNRLGLGNETMLNKQYFKEMLKNYINSDDIRQLQFEPTFTKEERADLHELAASLSLKSVARGTGEARYLTISKKNISDEKILTEILINNNPKYCDKYFVQVPVSKQHLYPDFTRQLDLFDQQAQASE